jgi:ABC-type Zn2+ transport system substrate-binding protein/surface adhesin
VKKRTGKIPQWIRDLKDKNIQVYDFLVSIYDKMYPQPEEEELHNHDHDHDHEHVNEEEQDGSE